MAIIYKTTNLINGKIYIGQHYTDFNDGYLGSGTLILKAISKYGKENFTREILESCDSLIVNEREIYWIAVLNSRNQEIGYNLEPGGNKPPVQTNAHLWMTGRCVSNKTRQKLRESKLGTHPSEETLQKMRENRLGSHHSNETKIKIGLANKGMRRSEEINEKNRQGHLGQAAWNKGQHYKGKPCAESTKKKISESNIGKHHSELSKQKMRESRIGLLSNCIRDKYGRIISR